MCHGVYVGFDAFALIIPLLFAIGMVVGQGSGGRKLGRGRVDQEVESHLLPRHTPQNPTTFSYIPAHFPTFPHIFLHSRTFSYAFSVLSRTPPCTTRASWSGKGSLCCRCGEPGNPTKSYTTLHPSACLAILQLSAAILHFPAIPSNLAKLAEKG